MRKKYRARAERLTAEVRDGKRRRDIRKQSLIAPELTPTHARSGGTCCAFVRLFGFGTRIPQIFPPGRIDVIS